MITIGLDFGTHQTKVCIEERNGTETHYKFHKFRDTMGIEQFTFPSILCIKPDNRLEYGFVNSFQNGVYKRYFKQAVYRDNNSPDMTLREAALYSIWYLAFILFDLEQVYGQEFTIQMGAPSDSEGIDDKKAIAVTLLASAYRLVEDEFQNNKDAFLHATYNELVEKTEIVKYSDKVKRSYGILVFPEAYACLMPMIGRGKISHGMSLVVDIGGGTTDISFFTIEREKGSYKDHPQVYDFFSINKGLNYLTESAQSTHKDITEMIQFFSDKELKRDLMLRYFEEIQRLCQRLIDNLKSEWKLQTELRLQRLTDKLNNRPIVFTGGGSTIRSLQRQYLGFNELHLLSYDSWKSKDFDDKSIFKNPSLCPILSTAYGLSISVNNDTIVKKPFRDIFIARRGDQEEKEDNSFGSALGGFDYSLDDSAWK